MPSVKFQSTLPCGSDRDTDLSEVRKAVFQSTLPCGSDGTLCHGNPCYKDFNPRSLAGATVSLIPSCRLYKYFNPRSLAGATLLRYAKDNLLRISIHAPLRERLLMVRIMLIIALFQSTLPCGSDIPYVSASYFFALISIHAPLRERQHQNKLLLY